ncbi:hypothetical protein Tco_0936176, partial [Tanacetum coccineum]
MTAKRNQERVKSILLLVIPDEYLLKFHNVPDAKSLWAAIKSRFGRNDESKKMHKNVLKHQFENFTTAPNESLDKAYDRFQKLISQLEVHAASVSKEDINQKFLSSWSQIDLIMRNKPDIDQTDIDDLYNNLRVYEDEMKRSLSSTSNSQNLAFLSSKNTSSTNEVSPASGNFRGNFTGGTSLSSQTMSPPLDNEDLQQIGQDDLEELDIRWQVAMLNVRVQRFIQKIGRKLDFKGKQHVTFDKRNATTNEPSSQALVAQDGLGGYDWSNDFDEPVNYALMAISSSSSSSSSNNEGYELALKSLEFRILGHEKNELAWGEKYEFQNYELKCREVKIDNLKMELEKVVKERDELKVKIEKWEESSKGLNKILNSQMSAKDKNGLGYGTQLDEMSNKSKTDSEISMSVFEVRSSDEEIIPANDRFSKPVGYHAVPPPITGNFLTLRADISFAGKTNEVNIEKPKSVYESVVPKPKINRDKVIIEDWNSDDEDDMSAVKTISPVKTNETQTVRNRVDKIGQISQKEGIGFKKIKACFVCKRVLTRTGLVNPVMPNGKIVVHTISTARQFAPKIAQTGSAIRPIYPRMDNIRPRASYSPIKRSYYKRPVTRPKDLKQDVKISRVKNMTTARIRVVVNTGKGKMDNALKNSRWVWRPKENYMDHESKEKGSFILKKFEYVDPKGISKSVMTWTIKITIEALWLLEVIPNENEVYSLDFKKLEKKCKPSISHHRAWLKSVNKLSMKKRFGKKESVSKQGRKKSKPESTLDDSTVFDDQDADHGMEYMEIEEAMDEGRQTVETEEVKLT